MKNSNFAERLKLALNIRNMRQIDLANKTGIDKSLISNYLKGKYEAKQNILHQIAICLNVNPVWLMGYDIDMEADIDTIKDYNSVEEFVISLKNIILKKIKCVSDLKKLEIIQQLIVELDKILEKQKK